MPSKQVKVGVFVPGECQLLDASCIDVLAMASKEYLDCIPLLPQHVRDLGTSVSIFYIAPGDIIPMTAGFNVQATHDLSHPDVQPGKLDVLLVPGPDPSATWDEETLRFLREHAKVERTDVLSVCTGILLCAAAGITDGKTVCGPRGIQADLRKKYPGTKFVGEKYRWIQDGNLWSSGGVTNGNDLVAAYIRSGKHFPAPLADIVCEMADVGDRAQVYEKGQSTFTIGFLWQIVRALFARPK